MATYAFYKYKLSHATTRDDELDLSFYYDDNNIFEKEFHEGAKIKLEVAKPKVDLSANITYETYNADVLANRNGVVVLTLENNKQKNTIIDKRNISHDHHPYCQIIIDYRENQNFIAIERNIAFNGQPDKACEILLKAFRKLFLGYGLEIEIFYKTKEKIDFWEAVNTIMEKTKDKVKRISLAFHDKQGEEKPKVDNCQLADILAEIAEKAKAKGLVCFETEDDNGEVDIHAIHEDLVNLANVCLTQKRYDLEVTFKSYGLYRYGSNIYAQFGIDELILSNFISPSNEFDFDNSDYQTLEKWLLNMGIILATYEDTKFTIGATKQNDRM